MTIYYVDSAAGGANNGTSWTDAWTSLSSSTGVAAGDFVYVDDGHSEAPAVDTTYNWANGTTQNPVKVLCVDKADDSLSTGASIAMNGAYYYYITCADGLFMHGMSFSGQGSCHVNSVAGLVQCEHCTFTVSGTNARPRLGNHGAASLIFRNCTFALGTSSAAWNVGANAYGWREWHNCTFTAVASQAYYFLLASSPRMNFYGCDFQDSVSSAVISYNNGGVYLSAVGCSYPSGSTFLVDPSGFGTYGGWSVSEQCGAGTLSAAPLSLTTYHHVHGSVTSTTSVYRTGGADDGVQANPYSWEIKTDGDTIVDTYAFLPSPWITCWTAGGSEKTYTLYLASGGTLQDDELWIDFYGPSNAGTATYQQYHTNTRCAPLGTPANLTTDGTSTWNGTGVGTAQKISVTYTPTIAGPVRMRVLFGKASTATVYVDPKIEVT